MTFNGFIIFIVSVLEVCVIICSSFIFQVEDEKEDIIQFDEQLERDDVKVVRFHNRDNRLCQIECGPNISYLGS